MPFELIVRDAGEFACDIGIFFDVGYLETQRVSVRGSGAPDQSNRDK
jgi:hypothetical protein